MPLTLCAVQFTPQYKNKAANTAALLSLCGKAADELPRPLIICLPEMCTTGYIFRTAEEIEPLCESARGDSFDSFSALCRENGIYCAYGFAEKTDEGLFNSQNFVAPDGSLLATYRKVNLFESDTWWAKPGRSYQTLDTPLGRIGLGICMDLNYRDFVEWHIAQKTRIILFSTNWLDQGVDISDYWCERLEGYGGIFVAANRAGNEFGIPFIGISMIVSNSNIVKKTFSKDDQIIFIESPE